MKKTTTRLATATAVLLMSAFAIILAQHDARENAHNDDSESDIHRQSGQAEPPLPLTFDGWPSVPDVVRGNNDGSTLNNENVPQVYNNPLRNSTAESPEVELDNSAYSTRELFGAEVVTASGENPAPPAALSTLPGNTPALQPLPDGLSDAFSKLDNLPGIDAFRGNNGTSPATSTAQLPGLPGTGADVPSTASTPSQLRPFDPTNAIQPNRSLPIGQPTGAPPNGSRPDGFAEQPLRQPTSQPLTQPSTPLTGGVPAFQAGSQPPANVRSLSGNANPGGSGNLPTGNLSQNNSSASMSDTQRGAMVPTQLGNGTTNNLPSFTTAQTGNGYPNAGQADASFSSKNTNTASLNPAGSITNPSGAITNPSGAITNPSGVITSPGPSANPANVNSFANNLPSGGQVGSAGPGRSIPSNPSHGFQAGDSINSAGPRATLASNQPGSRFLDGSQNPVMQIHKRAPEEITVGKKATFVITVRNAGNSTAHEVTVVDRIPRGVKFSEASPAVSPTADGSLTWKLGEMNAGEEKTIHLQVIPETEGEIGSVASVHFAAQASVRTMATAPKLEIQVDSSGPVIIGQTLSIPFTIRNLGSGVARGVRLEVDVPSHLKHESGESELELNIGDIRPNDTFRSTFNAAAVQPGQSACPLRAVNEDGVQAQSQFSVDVRAPQLAATITGPARRYLERQATYQVVVSNTGTAVARNMSFDVHLPVGLKFVSVDIPQARYFPESHSIALGLGELNPGASGAFNVTVLPVELGPQNVRVNATGELGIAAEAKGQMVVEGLSELAFTIGQDNGTVEVGAITTYSVQISNVGNQSDKNVQLQIAIPEGAKLLRVDAPVDHREEPGRVVFAPIGEMRSRDVKTLRFQLQHNRAGNQIVRAQLTSTNWPVAVVKEEGTLVYNDQ